MRFQAVASVASSGKFYRLPPDKENTVFSIIYASLFFAVHFVETFERLAKTFQFLKTFTAAIQDHLDINIRHRQFVNPLQRNSLYCAVRLANLEGILG